MEIGLLLAHLAPEQFLLEKLSSDLEKYKAEKTEENKKELIFNCQMLLAKHVIEKEGLDKTMKDCETSRSFLERMNTKTS